MVVKKKSVKKAAKKEVKTSKKAKKVEKESEEEEGGTSLDDAFGDDDGVDYGESKPRKENKKKKDHDDEISGGMSENELDSELDGIERAHGELSIDDGEVQVKASKPVSKVKKGDKIKIDGREYEVDAHYVLIDHKTTKEMAIELFDTTTDRDFQIRYFDDQVERTLEFYELQEIMFIKRPMKKIEW